MTITVTFFEPIYNHFQFQQKAFAVYCLLLAVYFFFEMQPVTQEFGWSLRPSLGALSSMQLIHVINLKLKETFRQ